MIPRGKPGTSITPMPLASGGVCPSCGGKGEIMPDAGKGEVEELTKDLEEIRNDEVHKRVVLLSGEVAKRLIAKGYRRPQPVEGDWEKKARDLYQEILSSYNPVSGWSFPTSIANKIRSLLAERGK